MSKMTREDAIRELSTIQDLFFWMKDRVVACSLAIKALRGEAATAQRDQLLEEVGGLREINRKLKSNGAVSALGMCSQCEGLKAELTELRATWQAQDTKLLRQIADWVGKVGELQPRLEKAEAELAAEREKVEKFRKRLSATVGSGFGKNFKSGLDIQIISAQQEVLDILSDEFSELFPDHAPEPELHDWAWALEELKAGRKVRWIKGGWVDTVYWQMVAGWVYAFTIVEGKPHKMLIGLNLSQKMLTEPGWLPYEECDGTNK